MTAIALTTRDIDALNNVYPKLSSNKRLSEKEQKVLMNFLYGLPSTENLLLEKFPLDDQFEIQLYDIGEMRPHIEKWLQLFNRLPKEISKLGTHAGWLDAEEDDSFWKRKVIIEAEFIPSYALSKCVQDENRTIGLRLRVDGEAYFEFIDITLAENFPDLYNFKGSWKEAYLLTVKTLQQGWPQTKFPPELEQFLKT